MKEAYRNDERADDSEEARPKADLYDPWQRQFISHNKRNEFRKAMESFGPDEA